MAIPQMIMTTEPSNAPTIPQFPKATKYVMASCPDAKPAPARVPTKAIEMANDRLSMKTTTPNL